MLYFPSTITSVSRLALLCGGWAENSIQWGHNFSPTHNVFSPNSHLCWMWVHTGEGMLASFSCLYPHPPLCFVVVQLLSCVWPSVTPWTTACQVSLSFTISQSFAHVHWVGDTIQTSHPLSCPSPPALSLSQHRIFSNESVLYIRWSKYWSFDINPSNEYSGLISFRTDWFYLLAIQGPLKSLLQHHNLKASVLWHSVFFMIQLSHLYMTTGKNHSFDYTDLHWQSDVSAFYYAI